MEPFISLKDTREPLYMQIYDFFKGQIVRGSLKRGDKLPSIRELSSDIKVSKTTVETAYNQLAVEGYVNNVPKKGYFVVELEKFSYTADKTDKQDEIKETEVDYVNTGVDKDSFDTRSWRRAYNYVLTEGDDQLYSSGNLQGEEILRSEIRKFVKHTRGVNCNTDQILVGSGVQQLLGILCSLLRQAHDSVAIEYPGFVQAKNIFEDYNMDIQPIPVNYDGIDVNKLKESTAKLVYLSPSHQYPTGSVMPIDKRLEILNWAGSRDALIIEDDYDCLIRYESRPIPALQGLDKAGHVVYLGSFSKILLPSVRISYLILPYSVLSIYNVSRDRYAQSASKLEQLTLGKFMMDGLLDKHIRRIKKVYRKKNEAIINYITRHATGKIEVLGHDSGLHMMLALNTSKDMEEIIDCAKKNNIYLEAVRGYGLPKLVVFPYSGIRKDEIEDVLDLLIHKIV